MPGTNIIENIKRYKEANTQYRGHDIMNWGNGEDRLFIMEK